MDAPQKSSRTTYGFILLRGIGLLRARETLYTYVLSFREPVRFFHGRVTSGESELIYMYVYGVHTCTSNSFNVSPYIMYIYSNVVLLIPDAKMPHLKLYI